MLVLTRKVGEQIVVGREIVLVINRISGNRVSIGIEAPEHVRILRGELPLAGPFDDPEPNHSGPDHCGPEERISPGSKAAVSACD
jgi:carbon storage regulator CsrA